MSVMSLPIAHFEALVHAATKWGHGGRFAFDGGLVTSAYPEPDDLTERAMVAELIRLNRAAGNARYHERGAEVLADGYRFPLMTGTPDPVRILTACHCAAYNCDLAPDWSTSDGRAFLQRLEFVAVTKLPGYGAPAWPLSSHADACSLIGADR